MVSQSLEHGDDPLHLLEGDVAPALRGGGLGQEEANDRGVSLDLHQLRPRRPLGHLIEHPGRLVQVALLHQRLGQVGHQLQPGDVVGRQQPNGASEQVRGGTHVAPPERTPSRLVGEGTSESSVAKAGKSSARGIA